MHLLRRASAAAAERAVTDESAYATRRRFLAGLGFGGLFAAGASLGARALERRVLERQLQPREPLPAPRSTVYPRAGRTVTRERDVLRYNNFYEFGEDKREVWFEARDFRLDPYSLVVDGLVARPVPSRWRPSKHSTSRSASTASAASRPGR